MRKELDRIDESKEERDQRVTITFKHKEPASQRSSFTTKDELRREEIRQEELHSKEFDVTLTRRTEGGLVPVGWTEAWGLDHRVDLGGQVRIKKILPGGVVATHNAEFPEGKTVFTGDVIRAVNGQREDSDTLLRLLHEKSDQVILTLEHQEFDVTLTRRTEGGRVPVGWTEAWGIDLRVDLSGQVRITKILPGSVVATYNAEFPEGKTAFIGDVIRAVNGQREDSDTLLRLLFEKSDQVTLTLEHQEPASQISSFTTEDEPRREEIRQEELHCKEFDVTLTRRTEGGRVPVGWTKALGIDVRVEGKKVRIKKILPGGVVATHNAEFPEGKTVFIGDVIRAVNGQREDSDTLLRLLDEKSEQVTLKFEHCQEIEGLGEDRSLRGAEASATGEAWEKPKTKVTEEEFEQQRAEALQELKNAMTRSRWILDTAERRVCAEDVERLRSAISKAKEARFTTFHPTRRKLAYDIKEGEDETPEERAKRDFKDQIKEKKGKKLLPEKWKDPDLGENPIKSARELLEELELNLGPESDIEDSVRSQPDNSWEVPGP
jgi:hypothetical protein